MFILSNGSMNETAGGGSLDSLVRPRLTAAPALSSSNSLRPPLLRRANPAPAVVRPNFPPTCDSHHYPRTCRAVSNSARAADRPINHSRRLVHNPELPTVTRHRRARQTRPNDPSERQPRTARSGSGTQCSYSRQRQKRDGWWLFARLDGSLFLEPLQPEIWIPAIVPQHPNPDIVSMDVVQKMVREAVQITATKSAPIKMEILRVSDSFPDSDLKLCEEILPKLMRNAVVLTRSLVQIRLNSPVEPSFHDGEARQPARRK